MITTEQLRNWCHGVWLTDAREDVISELIIDSRKINQPEHALFIALKSARRDGHSFIRDAWEQGVRMFLVAEEVPVHDFPGAGFIKVTDTLTALQQVIVRYRRQFDIPVIGITGSNGKTIVKEWLAQLLSARYNLVRSPMSYNSQIGVPLSVWLLEPQHELAIFEAGISRPGEMELLERMIEPSIGIITNIGAAHSEGFLSQRQKLNEKLILFRHAKHLIYCSDYPELNECIVPFTHQLKDSDGRPQLQLFTWSQKHDADLRISRIARDAHRTTIEAAFHGNSISITIPFTDPASIENAVHCWCTLLLMEVPQEEIAAHMLQLQPVAMRLELRQGINDCTIINDSYNSDLTSLYIALDYLKQQQQHRHHTVILSDMLQTGKPDAGLYEEVAEALVRRGIHRFIGIGPALYKHKNLFRAHKQLRSVFFKSTKDFLRKMHLLSFNKEAILLKGARVFAFEEISALLEQDVHQTVLSVNLSGLTHNLDVFRRRTAPGVKTMAMVKAFSYGSGSHEIANVLQYAGADYLGVAYTDEGIDLRKAGITMPIMVMSPDAGSFDRMIAWKLEPELFNLRSLEAFTAMAATLQVQRYPVHIKLDTGMHRLGFMPAELDALIAELQRNGHVQVASIFSHLAASEDEELDAFTLQQAETFRQMSDRLVQALGYMPLRHLCNSAGIARHPELHFDMVRLGLGLYGVDSSGLLADELQQVGTLRTSIAQIKDIPAGETVGYSRKGVADRPMRIATICVGYADGYPRALGSGKAYVLIRGRQAKTVGVVCMDMCMVDISEIPEAAEGDEVIVFGPGLLLTQLAQWAGTIPYEIMTGISQRVKRVYVNE